MRGVSQGIPPRRLWPTATHWLVAYLAALVAVTFVHEPLWLAALLVAAFAASGTARRKILHRAVLAVLTFNLTVSLAYAAVSLWQGRFPAAYLLLVNLRVLLLAYLGFWFVARVNLIEACRFSPTLGFVVTLAAGQIEAFSRSLRDFRLAFVSRNAAAPRPLDRARHAAAQAGYLLDKSVASAAETALAMRSRGCFDDYSNLPAPARAPGVPPSGRAAAGEGSPAWRPHRSGAARAAWRKP